MPGDWPVFDVDSHFMEPADLWHDHIDPAFRDRAPVGSDDRSSVVVDGDRHFPTVRWRRLGVDCIVTASDFPHPEGTFPEGVREFIARDDLEDDTKHRILWDNANRLYGL